MSSKNIAESVSEWVVPILDELSLSLYEVTFKKEGSDKYLRITLDKEDGGVSISDCETVSRFIDKILEEKDPIEDAYILEVSSPGIERVLKKDSDFTRFSGQTVDVKFYKALDGQKVMRGHLVGLNGDIITVKCGENVLEFDKSNVAQVKTVFEF